MNTQNHWIANAPCPKCKAIGRDHTDNHLGIYSDGHGYCKVHGYCKKPVVKNILKGLNLTDILDKLEPGYNYEYTTSNTSSTTMESNAYSSSPLPLSKFIAHRGLTEDTLNFFGVKFRGDFVVLPYGSSNLIRSLDHKQFHWEGYSNEARLFGQDKFSSAQSRSITVCESAYDASSVYQMLGSRFPAVAVRSASTARGDCERAREYLNGFERIYLCFDNDLAGENAAREVAKIFDSSKIYHVKLTKHKDANEYLTSTDENDAKAFVSIWYNARPYLPQGVVNSWEDVESILSQEEDGAAVSYPFPTLEDMTGGIRYGEVTLLTAQEGVGKTEVLRAIEYHILKNTDENIAVIHLEEGEKRATQGLIGYELGSPVHMPDAGFSREDQFEAFKSLTKRTGRLHLYSHFGSDDPNTILDIIRYLATSCHCKFITLDHITMLVTGFEDDDERKKLDYLSTRLAMLAQELGFALLLVSHVNDDGKTRGSRNISKVAHSHIRLERDVEATTLDDRTTTSVTVIKNRFGWQTGPAGYLKFDPKTFMLKELEIEKLLDIDLS